MILLFVIVWFQFPLNSHTAANNRPLLSLVERCSGWLCRCLAVSRMKTFSMGRDGFTANVFSKLSRMNSSVTNL